MIIDIKLNITDETALKYKYEVETMLINLQHDINSIEIGQSTKRHITGTDGDSIGTAQITKS